MKVDSCLDPTKLTIGTIIFHSPRQNFYVIVKRVNVKSKEGWESGWEYQKLSMSYDRSIIEFVLTNTGETPFVRPDSLFDSDWVITSLTLAI